MSRDHYDHNMHSHQDFSAQERTPPAISGYRAFKKLLEGASICNRMDGGVE